MPRALSILFFLPVAAFATACSQKPANPKETIEELPVESVAIQPAAPAINVGEWAGRWVGPEGMFVAITPQDNGSVSLEMQSDLDTHGTYVGHIEGDGIRFERGGEQLSLRKATGDETGLKWLAGKQNCLMVKSGEGYCRD